MDYSIEATNTSLHIMSEIMLPIHSNYARTPRKVRFKSVYDINSFANCFLQNWYRNTMVRDELLKKYNEYLRNAV